MSSLAVRTTIKNFITTEFPGEKLVDFTAQYAEMKELLQALNIGEEQDWLGIEFYGGEEEPITVPATNDQGKYREEGAIEFHIVTVAQLGAGDTLLTRAEALRDRIRGQRIGLVTITSMTTPNTGAGATLQFDGGFMSASFFASYEYEKDL